MKYTQLVTGLLIGTALGGSVVASTGSSVGTASKEDIREIVRETIMNEPQLIMDSVQKYQNKQQADRNAASNEVLKDMEFKAQVLDATNDAYAGPKDAKHVIVEFFDYNCGACKGMFANLDKLLAERKDVKVIFREFPIFGDVSETNSRLGLAIWNLYPDRYYEFHKRMMETPGQDKDAPVKIIKDMGLDLDKIKEDARSKKYTQIISGTRDMAQRLHVQGTPSLIIGNEFIPHGLSYEDLQQKLGK